MSEPHYTQVPVFVPVRRVEIDIVRDGPLYIVRKHDGDVLHVFNNEAHLNRAMKLSHWVIWPYVPPKKKRGAKRGHPFRGNRWTSNKAEVRLRYPRQDKAERKKDRHIARRMREAEKSAGYMPHHPPSGTPTPTTETRLAAALAILHPTEDADLIARLTHANA